MKGLVMYSITSNAGATGVAYQLGQTSKNLQKSVQRLSSMLRINSSSDDPGGLAMSMKLGVSIRRTEAMMGSVNNTASFLQAQDGILGIADDILLRMEDLAVDAAGETNTSSLALYDEEFQDLKLQILDMLSETFNGQDLFYDSGGTTASSQTITATISLTGQTVGISQADIGSVINLLTSSNVTSSAVATDASEALDNAINNLAALRAANGSEQNRIGFASDLLSVNKLNLEAANSRIVDLDYAAEMLSYTKLGIIQDSNIALLAQANTRSEKILRLLE
jgi:flagellin